MAPKNHPHRKRASGKNLFLNAESRLTERERRFLDAAEYGDTPTVRRELQDKGDDLNINRTDYMGRTALTLAVGNEHYEVVECLLEDPTLDSSRINEPLLIAISKGHERIAEAILSHRVYTEWKASKAETIEDLTFPTKIDEDDMSPFPPEMTPIIMACQKNEVDIIYRLVHEKGEHVVRPHDYFCPCNVCENRRKADAFRFSRWRLMMYRALASPAYISLSSSDPIRSAFEIGGETRKLAEIEKELKNEYTTLFKQCEQYAVDLLDQCRTLDEINTVLNEPWEDKKPGDQEEGEAEAESVDLDDDMLLLPRIKLAIRYEQKRFVSHPNCQQPLYDLWYTTAPTSRPTFIIKLFMFIVVTAMLPLLMLGYWLAPNSKIGTFMKRPLMKFSLFAASYFIFLALLIVQSAGVGQIPGANITVHPAVISQYRLPSSIVLRPDISSWLEITLMLFVAGFVLMKCRLLWFIGWTSFSREKWNAYDTFMSIFLVTCYVLDVATHIKTAEARAFFNVTGAESIATVQGAADRITVWGHYRFLDSDRTTWLGEDPKLVSECLFAVGCTMAFCRVFINFPISEELGPLQISLGRMMGDIIRFIIIFFVIFVAFWMGLFNLYNYYTLEGRPVESFGFIDWYQAFRTLFWSLFGMVELDSDPTIVPGVEQELVERVGWFLFGLYNVASIIVLLNMLIAMMNKSYEHITADSDVEWKFSRAKLYMLYFGKGISVAPFPFNLVPTPSGVYKGFKWLKQKCKKCKRHRNLSSVDIRANENSGEAPSINGTIIPIKALVRWRHQAQVNNVFSRSRVRESKYTTVMRRLVTRYIFKLQKDKENDEINEGELEEIKQDISSLRFDLLDQYQPASRPGTSTSSPGKASSGSGSDAAMIAQLLRKDLAKTVRTQVTEALQAQAPKGSPPGPKDGKTSRESTHGSDIAVVV
ncbi:PREDICTED: short transient receptor potential channel 3-like [Branchiostoma belcheri]|uniref:Short transient receptor potential channel 3-like n=1 Tax=Branchiostoma belcheri TaxID=7741 RepID=A0A6P4YJF5_BRABE|nr:PREDICTED: short transient receptor potential channel 3-like [Branchiostoma belcheri]XP_019629550.1 PREDICTED: short transient receptor potential channel 3-like [Branchiostoma belcheri]